MSNDFTDYPGDLKAAHSINELGIIATQHGAILTRMGKALDDALDRIKALEDRP